MKKRSFILSLTGAIVTGAFAVNPASFANQTQSGDAAEVEADDMTYLTKEGKVIAEGNVKIKHDGNVLKAKRVTYDQNNNLMTADENVFLKDKHGHKIHAESVEINDKLTQGTFTQIHGEFSDKSHFAANKGIRESSDVTVLEGASYSPCNLCSGNKPTKPLWQLTSQKVTLDSEEERLYYKHATLDFFGVPVLYTPYFSHPSPGASKKSGLLPPSYSIGGRLGESISLPYFFDIAPNLDATFEPIFTTKEGIVLSGEFRHLTRNGEYTLSGSITNPEKRDDFGNIQDGHEIRGHIEGQGRFSFRNNWQAGFDAKRTTDDTYLRRYDFGDEDLLTSRAYVEQVRERNFIGVETVSFQGLNLNDDADITPLILPQINTHFEAPTGYRNSRWTLDSNALILLREEGTETRRLSTTAGWVLPFTTSDGHLFTFKTSLRGDLYSSDDVEVAPGVLEDDTTARVIPKAELGWRYPLVRQGEDVRIFFEPLVDMIVSTDGNNPDGIANEDGQELQLTDINLFNSDHVVGLDRVENGARMNYGFRGGLFNKELGTLDFLLGQHIRAEEDKNFTPETGLSGNFSDYVGRVVVSDNDFSSVSYRFRLDKESLGFRRSEVSTRLRFSPITLNLNYLLLDEEDDEVFSRERISGGASLRLNENWSISGFARRDLEDGGRFITTSGSLVYQDECIRVNTLLKRDYTRDRDSEPDTSVIVTLSLMNLGNF